MLMFCDNEKFVLKALIERSWQDIDDFDLIILINWSHDKLYSDLAHMVAVYANNKSIEVWNSELIGARPMTKISQLQVAAENNIPIPATLFSFSKSHLSSVYSDYLSFPLIAKDPTASRGRRNFLVHNQEELQALEKESFPLLLQEYIKNDSSDIRVIVGSGHPIFAFKRTGQTDSHLHNISAGGTADKIDIQKLEPAVVQYTNKLAQSFKKELCGIDFMFDIDENRFIFLEINTTPQLINGIFADDKLKALSNSINKE
jgi:glutathione synthase/RimK-type ligase-like ATP-grasp enzyme